MIVINLGMGAFRGQGGTQATMKSNYKPYINYMCSTYLMRKKNVIL